jgi:hypothetical protein
MKSSVRQRLRAGHSPRALKAAFGLLVDRLSTEQEQDPRKMARIIRRLRDEVKALKAGGKVVSIK